MKKHIFLGVFCFWSALVLAQSAAKPFFIGHSLVNFDMPAMVSGLAKDAGLHPAYGVQVCNGAPLWWNYQNYAGCQGTHYVTAFPTGGYNHLIVTEAVPLQNHLTWSNTYAFADSFFNYATQHNAGVPVRFFVYETWHCTKTGTPQGCEWDDGDSLLWQPRLLKDFPLWAGIVDNLRQKHPTADICMVPAGRAFYHLTEKINAGQVPGIASVFDLFSDDIHLTNKGNYFVACVMFSCIYRRSPVGLTTQLKNQWGGSFADMPTPAQANIMQTVAWQTVQDLDSYSCVGGSSSVSDHLQQGGGGMRIFPNPISAGQPLQILWENVAAKFLKIEMLSLEGRVLQTFFSENIGHPIVLNDLMMDVPTSFFVRVSDEKTAAVRLVLKY